MGGEVGVPLPVLRAKLMYGVLTDDSRHLQGLQEQCPIILEGPNNQNSREKYLL